MAQQPAQQKTDIQLAAAKVARAVAASLDARVAGRGVPLTEEHWRSFMDQDGRVVDYSELKRSIFRGGIATNELRKDVWKFLFGLFPFHSTHTERAIIVSEKHSEYYALRKRWREILEPELANQPSQGFGDFSNILAEIKARRLPFDKAAFEDAARQIDKDVPRTDRELDYFNLEKNPTGLSKLRNVLLTYSAFHPSVGYVQGMNDVLSMLLVILDDEADAYCCFANYMRNVEFDFQEAGMKFKLRAMASLVKLMDPELHSFLKTLESDELFFCHRWLHVSFKREFSFENALRLFETLGTHYVGNTVPVPPEKAVQLKTSKPEPKKKAQEIAKKEETSDILDMGYKFELFFSLAILQQEREHLLKAEDVSDIYAHVNGLVGKLNLESILSSAERLFTVYCELVRDKIVLDNDLAVFDE